MTSGGTDDFVHLHVHSEYSMLDGASRIEDLVAEAARIGQQALAITDHGYLFGAYEFYTTAKRYGIKPIIGLEAYVTPGTSRYDRTRMRWGEEHQARDDVSARGAYTHLTLLARNNTGMNNLFRLGSRASLEGQWGKWPRMDRELLEEYAEGLIATTGCPSGEVQTRLRLGQYEEARRAAGEMQDLVGAENYYIELMDHGLDIEKRVMTDLLQLSTDIGAPLLATNDSHYTRPQDAATHEVMLALQSGSKLTEPTYDEGGSRFAFSGNTFYLRPSSEMRELFRELPEACDNTLRVADQCDVSFTTAAEGANYMPHFEVPAGEDEHSWFVKEVEKGLSYRYPTGVPNTVEAQARHEVEVITQMGFPGYFLVVADFINWAKSRGIRVGPGRGSGAGSMVAFVLRITDLDPLQHGLIFERFLNPDRVSMPDFDVDFDERRRGEVIDYVTEKYGHDRVAQVITYGTIKAKQALKDSARVLDFPFQMGEKLSKAMPPPVMGKEVTLGGIFDPDDPRYAEAAEFRDLHAEDESAQSVVTTAQGLEGLKRQWGVHACAVIMSSVPLQDVIPVMLRLQDGATITQFDYPQCEDLGLLKMDFLGLRNLTVIDDALDNISRNGKSVPDLESLPLDDAAAYQLLASGETLGVFQLDGSGMRTLLRQMRPDHFEDITAVQALYRPGPMGANSHTNYALRKNEQQAITPIHPELAEPLDDILGTTYGLIVYQEQVMAIAQRVAGYSLGQADVLRRAMGKKKKAELDQQYTGFEAGMRQQDYSAEAVKTLWDTLVPFSDYAFNKAHAAAYGLVSYWTAYLKANYPTEYMAALLTSTQGNKDRLGLYLGEARRMGITVLPPDVNTSAADFTAVGDEVRFGLAAIRNVGANVVAEIIAAREKQGAYTTFQDFLNKVPAPVCNKRTIESLVKAGAFDDTATQSRRALVAVHEEAIDMVVDVKRNEAVGQFDLFADLGGAGSEEGAGLQLQVPELPEWDKHDKLAFERQMLGLYVSDHPLFGLEHVLQRAADTSIATLLTDESRSDGSRVTIAGLVTSLQRKTTKNGNPWAIATVEDLEGSIEVLFFPQVYTTVATMLGEDSVITVSGRLNRREDVPVVFASQMTLPDLAEATDLPVQLTLAANRCTVPVVEQLKSILVDHPGHAQVHLRLTNNGRSTMMRLEDDYRVAPSSALFGDLKALLGPSCLAG